MVSRWSDICDVLAVARDAAWDGKPWLALKLVCDVAPDSQYVRRRARKEQQTLSKERRPSARRMLFDAVVREDAWCPRDRAYVTAVDRSK